MFGPTSGSNLFQLSREARLNENPGRELGGDLRRNELTLCVERCLGISVVAMADFAITARKMELLSMLAHANRPLRPV